MKVSFDSIKVVDSKTVIFESKTKGKVVIESKKRLTKKQLARYGNVVRRVAAAERQTPLSLEEQQRRAKDNEIAKAKRYPVPPLYSDGKSPPCPYCEMERQAYIRSIEMRRLNGEAILTT